MEKTSETEIRFKELLKECEDIVDDSYLKTQDARRIIDLGYNMLLRFEEIKKSRDSWKNKCNGLKRNGNNN